MSMSILDRIFRKGAPRWGVHPDDRKRPAADVPLRTLPLPRRLYLPLQQHIGQAARPVVLVGQQVQKGQLLADAQGNVSARIHAPASGTVVAIGEITAPHASGLPVVAITLEPDGLEREVEAPAVDDPLALEPAELARRIAAAGVVGLGGATFPAAVKLSLGQRSAVTTLLMNGGECEPYLSCDDRTMRDFAAEVVDGIRLMLRTTGAANALVGIEDNKPEAIAKMIEAARPYPEVQVRTLPALYPMGSERQLILMLTGREVPADARPSDIGVVVHNVGTARAVHRALRRGEALTQRIVTVNGGAVANPGNILVPIGALVSDVLAFAGLRATPARLVMGGPMMGAALPHADVPVVKGTSGILAFDADEAADREPGPCIRLPDGPAAAGDGGAGARRRPQARGGAGACRLHGLRLLRLRLPVAYSAGAVLLACQGRTGGARTHAPAQRGSQAPGRRARRTPGARGEGKAEAALRRKAERAAAKAAEAAAAAASAAIGTDMGAGAAAAAATATAGETAA